LKALRDNNQARITTGKLLCIAVPVDKRRLIGPSGIKRCKPLHTKTPIANQITAKLECQLGGTQTLRIT
jgi:hypothetical protein